MVEKMKKFSKKDAISMIEIAFIIFVLFFIYAFVVKQMLADLKFSDMKRLAARNYTAIENVSRGIVDSEGYYQKFRSEYDIIEYFAKNMQTEKICNDALKEVCWSSNWIWEDKSKPGFKLETGAYIISELSSATCSSNLNIPNTCGVLYIDVNGANAPNLVGHDIIKLYFTQDGLVPAGVKNDIINPAKTCDLMNKFSWACSAKLLGMK